MSCVGVQVLGARPASMIWEFCCMTDAVRVHGPRMHSWLVRLCAVPFGHDATIYFEATQLRKPAYESSLARSVLATKNLTSGNTNWPDVRCAAKLTTTCDHENVEVFGSSPLRSVACTVMEPVAPILQILWRTTLSATSGKTIVLSLPWLHYPWKSKFGHLRWKLCRNWAIPGRALTGLGLSRIKTGLQLPHSRVADVSALVTRPLPRSLVRSASICCAFAWGIPVKFRRDVGCPEVCVAPRGIVVYCFGLVSCPTGWYLACLLDGPCPFR